MKLEEFNQLDDASKEALLTAYTSQESTIQDLEAERDSFKTENAQLLARVDETSKELKATKELNFTLARKVDVKPKEDADALLLKLYKGE